MYVNNPLEDLAPPAYIANSTSLTKNTKTIENQATDFIEARWTYNEANPKENQGCYGALNDEVSTTYSIQKYSDFSFSGDYSAGNCFIEYPMPYYMPSGTYRLNYIRMFDLALNESREYFTTPEGIDVGDFPPPDGVEVDEVAAEIVVETSNPDTTPPELDLTNIIVTAQPTNTDAPNVETIVNFTFRVKDDITGYKLG